jgi:3-hydroxyisobutyrate dehydrogenase
LTEPHRGALAAPAYLGFVGLGRMGIPMAGHLTAAGYRVSGHDVSEEARLRLAREAPGAAIPGSLEEVARGADAVILMLPDSAVIAKVTGEQGLLAAMPAGSLLIDMSSAEPAATEALAREAAGRDIAVVGAPVSGGVIGAAQATLTIMVGGARPAVERAWPVLEVIGGRVLHVGEMPGAGHALKALNNLLSAINLLAASEAMVAGQRFGLDPAVMLEAINTSSGRSGSTQDKWPNRILPGTFDTGFTASLMVKDMLIGLGVERDFGAGSRLAEVSVDMWRRAASWLPAGADHTEIARWLEGTSEGDGG